jgi:hypothetical protein
MRTQTYNRKFDEAKDVTEALDLPSAGLSSARRRPQEQKRVNVDSPTWMIQALYREPRPASVTRQSIIKVWQAARLERSATDNSPNPDTDTAPAG